MSLESPSLPCPKSQPIHDTAEWRERKNDWA